MSDSNKCACSVNGVFESGLFESYNKEVVASLIGNQIKKKVAQAVAFYEAVPATVDGIKVLITSGCDNLPLPIGSVWVRRKSYFELSAKIAEIEAQIQKLKSKS